MRQIQLSKWLAKRAFKQVKTLQLNFHHDFQMCQHSNFLQTFTVKHSYIILSKTSKSAKMLPSTALKQLISDHKWPSYKQSMIQSFLTFNIYLIETINVTGRGIAKQVFRPSFRMKSGVEVKKQLIEKHSIFMYFPCSLHFLPTRKSAQPSCYRTLQCL